MSIPREAKNRGVERIAQFTSEANVGFSSTWKILVQNHHGETFLRHKPMREIDPGALQSGEMRMLGFSKPALTAL